jgi:RNA polymerase sigma factor (sigma-70 family)
MRMFGKQELTEIELIEGCAANERRAQEAFYRRFFPEMWRMCLRYTRSEDTAMEIVNAGMLRVFQKIHTFEQRGSLEGWVRRIVWHALADHFRSQKQYLHFLVFEERDEKVPETGPDQFYADDILKMVGKLPPATQQVFRFFAIEGYSHREISVEMNISEGTSKWHLNNARTILKELLNKQENFHRSHVG